jgi:hypothetical protein
MENCTIVVQAIHDDCRAQDARWPIDFDRVWPLFHKRKQGATAKLQLSMVENMDFIKVKGTVGAQGITPDQYYLTEDAFKRGMDRLEERLDCITLNWKERTRTVKEKQRI